MNFAASFKPLTKDDIADVLGVSGRTIENWVNYGTLAVLRRTVLHPSDVVLGLRMDVLAVRAGCVVVLAGLVRGSVLAVQCLRRPGSLGQRLGLTAPTEYAAGDDDDDSRSCRRDGGDRGPRFNVDGTPMLTTGVDVIGKSYGDDGHRYDAGTISSGGCSAATSEVPATRAGDRYLLGFFESLSAFTISEIVLTKSAF